MTTERTDAELMKIIAFEHRLEPNRNHCVLCSAWADFREHIAAYQRVAREAKKCATCLGWHKGLREALEQITWPLDDTPEGE